MVAGAPPLAWIDTTPAGELVGASPDGEIYATDLTTGDWEQRGSVAGQPTALNATDTVWHVATDAGIYASQDHGSTWTPAVGSTR